MNFTAAKLVAAERFLGKSIGNIIEEANAEGGMSLHTLTGLLAASHYAPSWMMVGIDLPPADDTAFIAAPKRASKEIDERGAATCGAEVGKALGLFVKKHFATGEAA